MTERGTIHTGSSPRRKRSPRGVVFVLAIISLAVLLILGIVSIQVATNNLFTAQRRRNLVIAEHLAEGAADAAEAYTRYQYQGSPPSSTFYYPLDGSYMTLGTGACRAIVTPADDNMGRALKRFTISTTGTATLENTGRTVIEVLQEQSFALYSYFTDEENSSINGDPIWFYARDQIFGPVHTNDTFHIAWDRNDTTPIFMGNATSSSATTVWGAAGTPSTDAQWRKIFSGGQMAYTLNAAAIPLPTSSAAQKNAAWGATSGFPTSNGITVPNNFGETTGGIYVRGSCSIVFSVESGTGNQIVTITRGSTTRNITIDRANNRTKITPPTSNPTYYSGTTNGVIFCDGDITSLRGTLADNYYQGTTILQRNAWTVATDVAETGDDIQITNNLVYNTVPDATQPWTHMSNVKAATLGIVSQKVRLDTDCPTNLSIHASILAGADNIEGGSFYYEGWDRYDKGNLNLLGGLIQKQRGPVGTFNTQTNQSVTGYSKNYNYDPRMVDYPPPFFPKTYQYDVISWQYR
ncbi:MAG: hypothetical protein ACYC7E_17960 [Armatimonadota bacterium]